MRTWTLIAYFLSLVLAAAAFGQTGLRGRTGGPPGVFPVFATPNDTGGDTPAIQAALNAAAAAGGGIVTISQPGTYWLDTPTAAPNTTYNSALLIGSNTRLVLAEGVVLKLRAEAVCYMIRNSAPTALITTAAEASNPTANTNISIEGGTWDANAVFTNVVDGAIASDGVTVTSSGFSGYTYTAGDAAYIWWAAPAATHTGASNTATAVTSTANCTGVVAGQTARFYTRGGGDTTAFGNFAVAAPITANGFTATSLTGNAASLSFDLFPVLGSTNISSTNGTNTITLASSVGVSKTSQGFTASRVTITTQNATPSGGTRTWLGHAMAFSGVDRICVKSTRIQNCSKYAILLANVTNGYFDSIYIANRKQGADGIHVNGPARGLVIKNISGVTDDNLLGFTTSEGLYFGGVSNTNNTAWTNISTAAGAGPVLLTKSGGSSFTSGDVGKYFQITAGTGATTGYYLITGFTDANNVTIADSPSSSDAGLTNLTGYVNGWATSEFGEGNISDVMIDGVYGDTHPTLGAGYELVRLVGKSGQSFLNFKIYNVSGSVRKGAAIKLADDSTGLLVGAAMRDILIDGVNCGSEYAGVYIPGTGVKDVTVRNVWCKEVVLASLTGVSTAGTAAVTASHQLHTYNGVGQVTNAYQSTDQVVFTSGANAGGRFFIDNTVSTAALAPLSDSVVNVFSTFPVSGSGQNAEIRRNSPVVWVGTGTTLDSLVIRDSGARDSSNVNYGGLVVIDGTVKHLVHDGCPMILGNGAMGWKIGSGGVVNYGALSRFLITDNGSGNAYGIVASNGSTRSYLTLAASSVVGAGGTLRGVYASGLLDLNVSGVRFGGNANLRPFEVSSGDFNIYGSGFVYGPTMPTNAFTVTAGSLRSNTAEMLLSSTSVTMNNATGTNTLLTPAASKTAVISKIILTVTAISSPSGTPAISAGITGAAYTDVVGTASLANFATTGSVASFLGKADIVVTNAAPLTLNRSTALASGTLTVQVDVYGFLR